MAPRGVPSVSTPSKKLALVASMPAMSSTSPGLKPVIVPAKARASLSTARAFGLKASVWPAPTAACTVSVAPVATESVPEPMTLP